jgi:dienelactone hydrolase
VLRRLAPVALLVLAAGCGGGGGGAKSSAPPVSLFAYDRSAPLQLRDRGRVNHHYPIQVRDVSYASPGGGRVTAYLVVPPGKGPFPGVVYLAGTGEGRGALVVPAAWLAARGAVGLSIDSAFVRTTSRVPAGALARLRRERDLTLQTVVDLRRGVDLLQSLPQVDPKRIGFVGYSEGGKIGAILAAVDHRIRAFDLMSAGSPTPESFVASAPASIRTQALAILEQINPLRYVGHAAPSALLFQDGREDTVVPGGWLVSLEEAASRPKTVKWYLAGHTLSKRAFRDQLAWLTKELRITGPRVPGTVTGP